MSVKALDPFARTPDSTRWGRPFVTLGNVAISLVCVLGVGSGDVGSVEFGFGLTHTPIGLEGSDGRPNRGFT